jgi:5-methyltetrahydrofolate--homocysteine methyltransferase
MMIVGENINATIPEVKRRLLRRDREGVLELAKSQAAAGATFIDVNVGTGIGSRRDELAAMQWAVGVVQAEMDIPLCIDSADPLVIEKGLEVRNGRRSLVNSVKADDENMLKIVRLAERFDARLVGLAMNAAGIPESVDGRLSACRKIADACRENGFPMENLYFDPLVLPIGADVRQGRVTLQTISGIKREFPDANTIMGLSNVSYGLPGRSRLNAAFLHLAIYEGLDAVILNPLDGEVMAAVRAAQAITGKDRHFRRYMRAFRKTTKEKSEK